MRKMWLKKASVAMLSLAMAVSCLAYAPMASAGQDAGDITDFDVVNDFDGETSEFGLAGVGKRAIAEVDEVSGKSAALPATWNSVSKGWVTAVKDQNPYGTCWSFAANSAMETSLIKQGIKVAGKKATKKNLNFSEKHTAYFSYHPFNDPLKNNGGDTFYFADKLSYLNAGGNGWMSSVTIANGEGPVAEKVAPYNTAEVAKKHDYKAAAHLKKAVLMSMYDASGNPALKAVKNAVKANGSVALEMGWSYSAYDYEGDYYNPTGYTDGGHAVTIVGWNDNFSKNNFEGYYGAPSKNGAWLVKNSWGTGWGRNGYFWVSYYDASFWQAWQYVMESKNSYNNCYFYSNMPHISGAGYSGYDTFKGANTFKITGKQAITAVGFGVDGKAKYSIQLYKNSKSGNPTSGKKLLSTPLTGTAAGGYTTVKLKKAVNVAKGDKISVVITLTNKSEYGAVYFWYDVDYDTDEWFGVPGGSYTAKAVGNNAMINPFGNAWYPSTDMSDTNVYTPCINLYTKNR